MTNAAWLILSFAIGQGSIFLAQTWLIHRGALDLLAAFATHFSFAILALMIVDFGAPVVVARRISLAGDGEVLDVARRCYWQASAVRLGVALVLSVAAFIYAWIGGDGFSRAYIPAAVPALLISAFNAAGVFDGLGLSGISGLTGMLAYIASAIALVVTGAQSADAGVILGVALSVGYGIAVVAQLVVLWRLGCPMRLVSVSVADCGAIAREGLSVLLAILPGQLSFRFQIVVCAAVLGQAGVGLFVYGRQIAAAASQVLEFVRRAHFPGMVRALQQIGTLRAGFAAQQLATLLAIALTLGLMLVGGGCFLLLTDAFAQSGLVVALFSVGVMTGALSQTLGQAAQGLGRFRVVALAAVLAMLIGFAASAGLGALLGLAGLAMAEVVTHVVGALVIWASVFRRVDALKTLRVSA
ncbi:hypothetical protein J5277_18825 [Rhizobium sp. 16-449-1b]|uniref:hypothetical protein n=1 Tax=Rhizobium sp. 16-449-1b TaxID=2819989 RepID=UPI001AD9EE25|nr:hypothetical protein [Rhizobium sp. 16-449-1b]MBO9196161.1 hypothetical protein [Rhizobium sp. 16-449-1b]